MHTSHSVRLDYVILNLFSTLKIVLNLIIRISTEKQAIIQMSNIKEQIRLIVVSHIKKTILNCWHLEQIGNTNS